MDHATARPLIWKLRRIAVGQRQLDVANATGLSTARYSGIERGEIVPSKLERLALDEHLYVNTRQQSAELMLDNEEQVCELVCALKQQQTEFAIFDVFNVMHAADENDNQEMRKVLRQLSMIQKDVGCGIGVVHHFNKADQGSMTQRLRGSSAIAGWAEWLIGISIVEMNLSTPEFRVEHTSRVEFPKYFEGVKRGDPEEFDANDRFQQLRSLIAFDLAQGSRLQDAAAKVKAKVFVISSLHDHMVNPAPALSFATMIGAQTLLLEGNCGHGAPMCEMDKVSAAVNTFLITK